MSDLRLISALMIWVLAGAVFHMGRSFGFDATGWMRGEASWIVGSAAVAALAAGLLVRRFRSRRAFHPGDRVIFAAQKSGLQPGPRAEAIYAFPNGEGYSYIVRKPWIVARLIGSDAVEVVTRGGKRRVVRTSDPGLRRIGRWTALWFCLRTRRSFPLAS